MKYLIVIVLVAFSCASAALTQTQSPINPASIFNQVGVTVVSPNQPGWVLLKSSKSETVFEKRDKDEVLMASVKNIRTKVFDNDKDLLVSLETLKKDDYAAVVAYDMRPEILSDFSADKRKAMEAMQRLRIAAFSESNLYDAVTDTADISTSRATFAVIQKVKI